METVTIRIDGQQYEVEKGIPLVLAAERAGIRVPHLCFNEGLSVFAGCRLCVVEIEHMYEIAKTLISWLPEARAVSPPPAPPSPQTAK